MGVRVRAAFATSLPVKECGFGDGERDPEFSASFRYICEDSLWAVDVTSMGVRGHGDGEVINVGEHDAPRYSLV